MTKKRFHIINGAENLVKYGIYCRPVLVDEETGKQYVLALDLMDILNELYEENKQFKGVLRELKEIGDYQADRIKELQRFEDTVFNSLNGKIKRGEKAIEWGESIGADVGAMGFHIELLKQFKKELSE